MARSRAGAAVGVASGWTVKCNNRVRIWEPLPDRMAGFGHEQAYEDATKISG